MFHFNNIQHHGQAHHQLDKLDLLLTIDSNVDPAYTGNA